MLLLQGIPVSSVGGEGGGRGRAGGGEGRGAGKGGGRGRESRWAKSSPSL